MKYERITATQRKALELATMRYLHVSVLVGTMKDECGLIQPTRTPKGKGATARRNPDIVKLIQKARKA